MARKPFENSPADKKADKKTGMSPKQATDKKMDKAGQKKRG